MLLVHPNTILKPSLLILEVTVFSEMWYKMQECHVGPKAYIICVIV